MNYVSLSCLTQLCENKGNLRLQSGSTIFNWTFKFPAVCFSFVLCTKYYGVDMSLAFHFITLLLACQFQRKSQAIVITRLSPLSSCKNFNVAHYSKSIKGINTKLVILAHYDKLLLQDKGHNSECYSFGVVPFLT